MPSKAEKRAAAKAAKQARFDASRTDFIAKMTDDGQPKRTVEPASVEQPKIAPGLVEVADKAAQEPKTIVDGSRFNAQMSWCTAKADQDGQWSWGEVRGWSEDEWTRTIRPGMRNLEGLTWQEIDRHASSSGHKMHHGHEISDLIAEAQSRWNELNLEEYDSVFRFRIGGQKRRAWGYIVQAHFHFVWWDREHSLYPTSG